MLKQFAPSTEYACSKNASVRIACIALIWAVIAYDIRCCEYLVARPQEELNPVALWLIGLFGVWTFMGIKVFGGFLVTEALRHLRPVYTYVILGVQVALLVLLTTDILWWAMLPHRG